MIRLRILLCLMFVAASVVGAYSFLPRGVVGAAPPPSASVPWYFNDASGVVGTDSLLDTSTGAKGTLWVVWLTQRTLNGVTSKYPECATLNLDTNVYKGPYICGEASPLALRDPHGTPLMGMDTSGYVYIMCCNIASPSQVSSTTNPRDPSSWTQQANFNGVNDNRMVSFAQLRQIGGFLWTFFTSGYSTQQQYAQGETSLSYAKMTSSAGGVPVWGASKTYVDLTPQNLWFFAPTFQTVGTKIATAPALFQPTAGPVVLPFVIGDVYFWFLDTATGNLSNFDGTTVIGPGSQPANYATLNSSFRVVSDLANGFQNGVPAFWVDNSNPSSPVAHIIYGRSTCDTGCAATVQYTNLSISGGHTVVSTQTIFTYPSMDTGAKYFNGKIFPNGSGGVTAIFPDATYPPGAFFQQGNIVELNRSAGGTWDVSPTIVSARTGYGLAGSLLTADVAGNLAPSVLQFSTQQAAYDQTLVFSPMEGFLYKDVSTPVSITLFRPAITSISPTSGGTGTPVTITGTNLQFVSDIKFGSYSASSFSCTSPTSCIAYSADGFPGAVNVTATNPVGTSPSASGNVFTVNTVAPTPPAPSASLPAIAVFPPVSPIRGIAAGGTGVTIAGANFTGATDVKFGTTSAMFSVNSDTSIYAITPAGSAGSVSVSVTTTNGTATADSFYEYYSPTQYYWNAFGSDSNNCLSAAVPGSGGVGACQTMAKLNASTFTGDVQINVTGTYNTIGECPTIGPNWLGFGANVTATKSVFLNGQGVTFTPNNTDTSMTSTCSPAVGGTAATLNITYSGGAAVSATIANGGSGFIDGSLILFVHGGTCSRQPSFNAVAFGGTIVSITSVDDPGSCSVPPANPARTTGNQNNGAVQQVGAMTINAQNVTACNWTIHGNGGYSMFGIYVGGPYVQLCNNSVDGFYAIGAPQNGFWGSDIYEVNSFETNIIADNATIGQSGVSSLDDNGIRAGWNGYGPNMYVGGNTVANIGVNERPGDHIPSSGSGIHNNSGGGIWQYNVSHDIGWNSLGGPSAFLVGGSFMTIQRNEGYNVRPAFLNGGGDLDGYDCSDEGSSPENVCRENYSHDNYGFGYLEFVLSHGAGLWGWNTIMYNMSENDSQGNQDAQNGAIGVTGGGSCSTFGCCGEIGPADIFNNTVYLDPGVSTYGNGAVVGSISQCQGSPGIWANNLFVAKVGNQNLTRFFTSNSLPTVNRTFTGNGYIALDGTPQWYQVQDGGSYGTLSGWQAVGTGGGYLGADLGAKSESASVSFTGTVSGTTLTASSVSGTITNGMVISSQSAITSGTLASGGSGYTNGTYIIQVVGVPCPSPPLFNVTVSGGVVTSVNSLASGGACIANIPGVVSLASGGGASATVNASSYPILPSGSTIVSGGPGGAGSYTVSHSVTISTPVGVSGALPVFASADAAGICTWTPSSLGPGPQSFSSCPAVYELGSGSIAYGTGSALNLQPYNLNSTPFFQPYYSPGAGLLTPPGIGTADYYLNSNNAGVTTKPHCIGAFDGSCGTNSSPPSVVVLTPSAGTVSGTVSLTASCAAASGFCQSINYTVSGATQPAVSAFPSALSSVAPYTQSWDTTSLIDGTYTLTAVGIDSSGNQATASKTVTISNGAMTCAQATTALAKYATANYTGPAYPITRLLCKGYAQGYASLIDAGYLHLTSNVNSALANAYSASTSHDATEDTSNGAVNFIPYVGFSTLTGGQIDTHFNPTTAVSPHYTQNSAGIHQYLTPNTAPTPVPLSPGESVVNMDQSVSYTHTFPQFMGETYGRINDAVASPSSGQFSPSSLFGLLSSVRSSNIQSDLYFSGTDILPKTCGSACSGAPGNADLIIGPPYFTWNLAETFITGAMTHAQIQAMCYDVTMFNWQMTNGQIMGPTCN